MFNYTLRMSLMAIMTLCSLVTISAGSEETVLFTDQAKPVEDEKLNSSIQHAEGLVKLINAQRFDEAGKELKKDLGIDVFKRTVEYASKQDRAWKGVIKRVKATHDRKNKTIRHTYIYDGGIAEGIEMHFWLEYRYDKDGLEKPMLFGGGC